MNQTSLNFKYILLISFGSLILLPSCIGIGKRIIFSPSAENTIPLKYGVQHIHGQEYVTKKSPADALEIPFSESDSSSIFISAKVIREKLNWIGPIIPFFPFWLIPGRIRGAKNKLQIYISSRAKYPIKLIIDSVKIFTDEGVLISPQDIYSYNSKGEKYFVFQPPEESYGYLMTYPLYQKNIPKNYYHSFDGYRAFITRTKENLILTYPIQNDEIQSFVLKIGEVYIKGEKSSIPDILFNKKKQKLISRFIGP